MKEQSDELYIPPLLIAMARWLLLLRMTCLLEYMERLVAIEYQ